MAKRAQLMWPEILGWTIAILVLVTFLFFTVFLKGKDTNAIDYFKTLLRFGR
jgi:hypothetical protein